VRDQLESIMKDHINIPAKAVTALSLIALICVSDALSSSALLKESATMDGDAEPDA
jgi:hypothetical protein